MDWQTVRELPSEYVVHFDGTITENVAYDPNQQKTDPWGGTFVEYVPGPFINWWNNYDGPVYLEYRIEGSDVVFDLSSVPSFNDTYNLNIPAGFFLENGSPTDNYTGQLEVKDVPSIESAVVSPLTWSTETPNVIAELNTITVNWPEWDIVEINPYALNEWTKITFYGPNNLSKEWEDASILSVEGAGTHTEEGNSTLVINLGETYTTEGKYTLTIPQGALYFGKEDNPYQEGATLDFEFWISAYTTEPRNGQADPVQGQLDGIRVKGAGISVNNNNNPVFTITNLFETDTNEPGSPVFASYETVGENEILVKYAEPWGPASWGAKVNVTIPAGTFAFNGVPYNSPITVEYNHRGLPNYATSLPVETDPLGNFSKVYLTWGETTTLVDRVSSSKVYLDTPSQKNVDITAYVTVRHIADPESEAGDMLSSVLCIDVSKLAYNAAGEYTLHIPAGVVEVSGYLADNLAQDITYTVTPASVDPTYTVSVEPGFVKSLDSVGITFEGAKVDYVDMYADMYVTLNGKRVEQVTNSADEQQYRALFVEKEDGSGFDVVPQFYQKSGNDEDPDAWVDRAFTEGGTYNIVIPAYSVMFDVDGVKVYYDKEINLEYQIRKAGYLDTGVALDPATNKRLAPIVSEIQGDGILLSFAPVSLKATEASVDMTVDLYIDGKEEPLPTRLTIVPAEFVDETGDVTTGLNENDKVMPLAAGILGNPMGSATGLSILYDTNFFPPSDIFPEDPKALPYGYSGRLRFEIPEGIVEASKDNESTETVAGDINQAQTVEITIAPVTEVDPVVSPETGIGQGAEAANVDNLGQVLLSWEGYDIVELTGAGMATLKVTPYGAEEGTVIDLFETEKVNASGKYITVQLGDYAKQYGFGTYEVSISSNAILLISNQGMNISKEVVFTYNYGTPETSYYLGGTSFNEAVELVLTDAGVYEYVGSIDEVGTLIVREVAGATTTYWGPSAETTVSANGDYEAVSYDTAPFNWVLAEGYIAPSDEVTFAYNADTHVLSINKPAFTYVLGGAAFNNEVELADNGDGTYSVTAKVDSRARFYLHKMNGDQLVANISQKDAPGGDVVHPGDYNCEEGDADWVFSAVILPDNTDWTLNFVYTPATQILNITNYVAPELPEVTTSPADGETIYIVEDMLTVMWGGNKVELVNDDASQITVSYDGMGFDGDNVRAESLTVLSKNPEGVEGGEYTEEEDNVLAIMLGGIDMPEWPQFYLGTYTITVPAGTVNVYVDGVAVPNDEVKFSYTISAITKKYTEIMPTVSPTHYANQADAKNASVESLEEITIHWDNKPIELNEEKMSMWTLMFETDYEGAIVAPEIEGNVVKLDVSSVCAEKGNGVYCLTIPYEGVMIDETPEVATASIDPAGEHTTYSNEHYLYISVDDTVGVAVIGADADGMWRVYNYNGVNVLTTNNGADLKNLEKGLYIINGKKVKI